MKIVTFKAIISSGSKLTMLFGGLFLAIMLTSCGDSAKTNDTKATEEAPKAKVEIATYTNIPEYIITSDMVEASIGSLNLSWINIGDQNEVK